MNIRFRITVNTPIRARNFPFTLTALALRAGSIMEEPLVSSSWDLPLGALTSALAVRKLRHHHPNAKSATV